MGLMERKVLMNRGSSRSRRGREENRWLWWISGMIKLIVVITVLLVDAE